MVYASAGLGPLGLATLAGLPAPSLGPKAGVKGLMMPQDFDKRLQWLFVKVSSLSPSPSPSPTTNYLERGAKAIRAQ